MKFITSKLLLLTALSSVFVFEGCVSEETKAITAEEIEGVWKRDIVDVTNWRETQFYVFNSDGTFTMLCDESVNGVDNLYKNQYKWSVVNDEITIGDTKVKINSIDKQTMSVSADELSYERYTLVKSTQTELESSLSKGSDVVTLQPLQERWSIKDLEACDINGKVVYYANRSKDFVYPAYGKIPLLGYDLSTEMPGISAELYNSVTFGVNNTDYLNSTIGFELYLENLDVTKLKEGDIIKLRDEKGKAYGFEINREGKENAFSSYDVAEDNPEGAIKFISYSQEVLTLQIGNLNFKLVNSSAILNPELTEIFPETLVINGTVKFRISRIYC